jgi:hypothetical protein
MQRRSSLVVLMMLNDSSHCDFELGVGRPEARGEIVMAVRARLELVLAASSLSVEDHNRDEVD